MAERPTLVVVGAATRDLDAADPRGWRLGGGVTYSSIAAARLGIDVRALVGVDREAAGAPELAVLRESGVDVRLARIPHGPVFDNRYTAAGRVQYSDGPSDAIPISALPREWRSPAAAILTPVAREIGDDWAGVFDSTTMVAIGVQGLLRELIAGRPVRPRPLRRSALVERAQILMVSAEDVAGGAPPLKEFLGADQQIAVTNGASGAVWISGKGARYVPPMPKREPIDATGAGDVFLGAWVATQLALGDAEPWRALLAASALASLSTQVRTIQEFPTVTDLCEVLIRLRD